MARRSLESNFDYLGSNFKLKKSKMVHAQHTRWSSERKLRLWRLISCRCLPEHTTAGTNVQPKKTGSPYTFVSSISWMILIGHEVEHRFLWAYVLILITTSYKFLVCRHFGKWMPAGHDLYILGLQESGFKVPTGKTCESHILSMMSTFLGEEYMSIKCISVLF